MSLASANYPGAKFGPRKNSTPRTRLMRREDNHTKADYLTNDWSKFAADKVQKKRKAGRTEGGKKRKTVRLRRKGRLVTRRNAGPNSNRRQDPLVVIIVISVMFSERFASIPPPSLPRTKRETPRISPRTGQNDTARGRLEEERQREIRERGEEGGTGPRMKVTYI